VQWKARVRELKRQVLTLYLACRDPRVPWTVRLLALAVVGYALSPVDLIPDWIPVLGYLDDLILVPLGIALVLKLMPPAIMDDYRAQADALLDDKPTNWVAGGIIIALWLVGLGLCAIWCARIYLAHQMAP
jgi:uncharacterized membrane protein YkvA (DUF1232 family)